MIRRVLLILAVLGGGTEVAAAQTCSASYSNVNFGVVDLTTNGAYPTSATSSVSCTGTPGQVIYVCGSANIAGPFAMGPVQFSLFQDAGGAAPWTSNGSLTIGANSTATLNQTVYGRLAGGQQRTAPGAYQTGGSAVALASYGTTPVCGTAMPAQVPAQVNYPASCHVSASDMTFSPSGLLTTATDATSTISVACSASAPYDVLLDGGNAAASNPTQRRLSFGVNQITYGLYQDAGRSQPWGSTIGVDTVAGSGTGVTQSLRVYGRIPPQTTPVPGTYQDSIKVTVSY